MTDILTIRVHAHPGPQGSKKAFVHQGRAVMKEQSTRLKPWRAAVVAAAIVERTRTRWVTLDGPIVADMIFTLPRPKGHYRTGRYAHLLRDAAAPWPSGPPDLSKLARSTEDALTDAAVWVDDSRVIAYGRLTKVWVGADPDALDQPGALIRVRPA